jgi:hypothetical protein
MRNLRVPMTKAKQTANGIELWANDRGKVHLFTVNVQTVEEAKNIVAKKYPTAEFISSLETPASVLNFLKLPLGKAYGVGLS